MACKTRGCPQVGEHGYGELAGSGLGFAVVELNAASVRAWRLVQVCSCGLSVQSYSLTDTCICCCLHTPAVAASLSGTPQPCMFCYAAH